MKSYKKIVSISFILVMLLTVTMTELKIVHKKSINTEQLAYNEPQDDSANAQTQSFIDIIIKLFA